jgi:hypothetical protein
MTNDIDKLKQKVLSLLSSATKNEDFAEIGRISAKAKKLQSLSENYDRIQMELHQLSVELLGNDVDSSEPPTHNDTADACSFENYAPVRVEIDWGKNGKTSGVQVIAEKKASMTLVLLSSTLLEQYGDRFIKIASNMQVSRGPLISKTPESDYAYTGGRIYSHHRILGTNYYVLTHSSSEQKVSDILRLLKEMGLKFGSYAVKKS